MGLCLSSKQHLAHAHLNRSAGPYIMYIEDLLLSFDRGMGFCAVYKKEKQNTTLYKFYAHAQQLKNEKD